MGVGQLAPLVPGLQAGRHVQRAGRGVDHRCGGGAEVGRQVRAPDRLRFERGPERPLPADRTGGGVDSVRPGLLGGGDHSPFVDQRLGVDRAAQFGGEDLLEARRTDRRGTEGGLVGVPAVAEVVVGAGRDVAGGCERPRNGDRGEHDARPDSCDQDPSYAPRPEHCASRPSAFKRPPPRPVHAIGTGRQWPDGSVSAPTRERGPMEPTATAKRRDEDT